MCLLLDGTSGAWTSLIADMLSASILDGLVGARPRSLWKSRKCMICLALRDMATYSLSSGLRGMHDVSFLEYARNGAVFACGGPTVSVYAECERLSAGWTFCAASEAEEISTPLGKSALLAETVRPRLAVCLR